MPDKNEEQQYIKDSKESKRPEACPICGSKKITTCPGGNSLKAVPGIWWICDDCKHQW